MTCDITYSEIIACNSSPVSIDLTGSTSVAWVVGVAFTTANHTVRTVNGLEYKCILDHTATADDEPAIGVNFKTYWNLVARPWVEYIELFDASNHYRWFSDGSTTPPTVTRDLSQKGDTGDVSPAAQAAQAAAELAETNAEIAQVAAELAETNAEAAEVEAESHRDLALQYKNDAASAVVYQDLQSIAVDKGLTMLGGCIMQGCDDWDGGANRFNKGASYYNEPLNVANLRGSRKERPSTCIAIATTTNLYLFDGDDPALNLWMAFPHTGYYAWTSGSGPAGTVSFAYKDGKLVVVSSDGRASQIIDFVADEVTLIFSTAYKLSSSNTIAGRVEISSFEASNQGILLLSHKENDVAITVEDDAPTDSYGRPISTIAIATESGLSVISKTGEVFDVTHTDSNFFLYCDFTPENHLAYGVDTGVGGIGRWQHVVEIPTADTTDGVIYQQGNSLEMYSMYYSGAYVGTIPFGTSSGSDQLCMESGDKKHRYFGRYDGLFIVMNNDDTDNEYLKAHVATNFNTGWVGHDNVLVAMCDTDDSDLVSTGVDSISDGTMDVASTSASPSVHWSFTDGSSANTPVNFADVNTTVAGKMHVGAGLTGYAVNIGGTVCDHTKDHVITFDISNSSANIGVRGVAYRESNNLYLGVLEATYHTNDGSVRIDVPANKFSEDFRTGVFRFTTHTGTLEIDNFKCEQITLDNDRSIKENPLSVIGTVTREFVASGSELVAYSGFSAGNYIEQEYNSDLDFGTGDFTAKFWMKGSTGSNPYVFSRESTANSTANPRFGMKGGTGSTILLNINGTVAVDSGELATGDWQQVCCTREDGIFSIYVDGELKATAANATDLSGTTGRLIIGNWVGNATLYYSGEVAMLSLGASSMSADQIRKSYVNEKQMFQPDTKITISGTSSAVVAVAYDYDKQELLVGTSTGMNNFKGLVNVEQDTDPVTAFIETGAGFTLRY